KNRDAKNAQIDGNPDTKNRDVPTCRDKLQARKVTKIGSEKEQKKSPLGRGGFRYAEDGVGALIFYRLDCDAKNKNLSTNYTNFRIN
ncbi:MAG: hypothetical protein L0Y76_08390, partial [Ignavibacteria bacterium]|nr:hypothetical protein [Ignavibacteria bacterium]